MFHRGKAIAAWEAKADRFAGYDLELNDALAIYEEALTEMSGLSQAAIEAWLAGAPWSGARPTVEHDLYPGVVIPFEHQWTNHQQAWDWAMSILTSVPTIAVDGSQITSGKELSIPVGAVQIGWFVNSHAEDAAYIKDIAFEVLAPDEEIPDFVEE